MTEQIGKYEQGSRAGRMAVLGGELIKYGSLLTGLYEITRDKIDGIATVFAIAFYGVGVMIQKIGEAKVFHDRLSLLEQTIIEHIKHNQNQN